MSDLLCFPFLAVTSFKFLLVLGFHFQEGLILLEAGEVAQISLFLRHWF